LRGLYHAGVTRRLVALQMEGGAQYLAMVQRVWDDGDAIAPLPVNAPRPHLDRLLATLAPQVLIDAHGEATSLPGGRGVGDGDALVIATSGTSGCKGSSIPTGR
jgi:O-succinylbenzoic acid--CoA ligase